VLEVVAVSALLLLKQLPESDLGNLLADLALRHGASAGCLQYAAIRHASRQSGRRFRHAQPHCALSCVA
jgi:hypothetical protein